MCLVLTQLKMSRGDFLQNQLLNFASKKISKQIADIELHWTIQLRLFRRFEFHQSSECQLYLGWRHDAPSGC